MEKITIEQARKVLAVVDAGLVSGLGLPEPGRMCVEAAVCFALGEPHGDEPSCVASSVRQFKIRLNDSRWSGCRARTLGMRKLAIAQLGSRGNIDEISFCRVLAKLTIQRVLPPILRRAGFALQAAECETKGSESSARNAKNAATAAGYAAAAIATVTDYAATAAYAATDYAADAATFAAAYAANAANAGYVAYAADYPGYAAYAAAYAANAAACVADADEILTISANCCLDALREVNAPGIALLNELGLLTSASG